MYCAKCGNFLQETDRFCGKCGAPQTQTQTSVQTYVLPQKIEVPKSRDELELMGYILAFYPLINMVLSGILGGILGSDMTSVVNAISLGLNGGLWFADRSILKKHGYQGKWMYWGLLLWPVYLYFRCRETEKTYTKFIVNFVLTVIFIVISLALFIPAFLRSFLRWL